MAEEPIGQRIKFLIDSLKLSVRKFAHALDVGETNIRNYLDRGTKPSSDVLEKISKSFPQVNLAWLITGVGDAFLPEPGKTTEPSINYQKNNSGNSVGTNHGTVSQQKGSGPTSSEQILLNEIQHLKQQLAMKDQLLAAKDETIDLLKAAYGRPN